MFLQYYLNENGDRVYTLKGLKDQIVLDVVRDSKTLGSKNDYKEKVNPDGQPTSSAHPARFSPDDKFSRHRVMLKKRFNILLTQQPKPVL